MSKFQENNKKGKGRPKGSKNKTSKVGKKKISNFLNDRGYDKLITTIEALEGMEYVKACTDLMTFVMPKLKAIDHTSGGEQIPYSLPVVVWVETEENE